MKKGGGGKKGSAFEREICVKLSRWWSYGERTDIFWRSSQSGGRATVRARQGKRTAGSYGDICALDPIGEPLLRLFTIELKRGQAHGNPGNLIDCSGSSECHPFLNALRQAEAAAEAAGSVSWLLISKRDQHKPCAFFPSVLLSGPLRHAWDALTEEPAFRYRAAGFDFVGISLEKFCQTIDPATIISL